MDYLHKFPIVLGSFMSIIIGFISVLQKQENFITSIRMVISLLIFYILGVVSKNILLNVIDEQKKKIELEKELNKKNEIGNNIDLSVGEETNDEINSETMSNVIKNKLNE